MLVFTSAVGRRRVFRTWRAQLYLFGVPGPDAVACSDLFDSLSLEFYYTLLHIRRLRCADPHPDGQHVVLPCCFVNFDYVLYFDEFDGWCSSAAS